MTYQNRVVMRGLLFGLSFLGFASAATNTTRSADQSTFLVVVSPTSSGTPIDSVTNAPASSTTLTATTTKISTATSTNVDTPLKVAPASIAIPHLGYKRKLGPLIIGGGYPDVPITSMPPRWYKRAEPSQSAHSDSVSTPTVTITVTSVVTVQPPDVTTSIPDAVTDYTTITLTHTAGAEATVQDTTAAEPSTTSTASASASASATYSKVELPGKDCVYAEYYDLRFVKRAPANNHEAGVQDCQQRCTEDAKCKYFLVFKYDPEKAGGKSNVGCQLSSSPYDKNKVQCNYMSDFSVSYNKNE